MVDQASRIAFQGERGAYSEGAAIEFFGEQIEPVACHSFEDVFEAVESGEVDWGMVPIENSLGGSIHRNYDLLVRHQLYIVGEHQFRVRHCLIGLPDVEIADISKVLSHPQALAQTEAYLDRFPGVERVATYDTAGSVKMLKDENMRDAAAVASRRAAEVYGMKVLDENIEDDPENYTRFLALATEPVVPAGPTKTSLVFSLRNEPGALFKALSVFALRDLDLTKIESRPLKGRTWEYLFYLDFVNEGVDNRGELALAHLGEIAPFLRVLGSYPRAGS